jgi:DNA helicase-2/ATP-dependent DNA helicase PcrA
MTRRSDAILDPLNPAQREAVVHVDGPLFVLAGAGSGKTRVITHRLAYLMDRGFGTEELLAITFTNKAAGEMRDRTQALTGVRSPWIATFHSFAARILRRWAYRIEPYDTSFTILDMDDCKSLIKELLKDLDVRPELWQPSAALGAISRIKSSHGGDPNVLGGDYRNGQILRKVYLEYRARMSARNLMDFDDLLLNLLRVLDEHPDVLERYRSQFRHVLVDEYQDTNALQYRICRLLTSAHENLCITGDPDQSIYKWRGADSSNILNFERDYPSARTVKLEQNYRSTANILRAANALIAHNTDRKPKDLWTENEDGEPVRVTRAVDEHQEAARVAARIEELLEEGASLGDIAVFYRINALSRVIEQELIFRNLPYVMVGGLEFFLRKEVKDVIAYARSLDNPRDSESLKRIINVPARGIGKATIDKLEQVAAETGHGLLEVVLRSELRPDLTRKAALSVDAFRDVYLRLETLKSKPMGELARAILTESGYERYLTESQEDDSEERLANLGELVVAADEFDRTNPEGSLRDFLELTAILGDVDRWEQRADRVSLMTIHSAKGLEFPTVFLIGCEDGILPLVRADSPDVDLEEERRLLYVAITRARKQLSISHAQHRSRYGRASWAAPSRFLGELEPPSRAADDSFRRLVMDAGTEKALYEGGRAATWDEFFEPSRSPGSTLRPSTGGTAERRAAPARGIDDDAIDPDLEIEQSPRDIAHRDDGFEVDEDPYPTGARVEHDEYGEGRIVRSNGFGRMRRVTVAFENWGEKQLVVQFVRLRRIR